MKVLIVEDETAAYENLKSIIAEVDPMIELSGHTESVIQTIRWLGNHPVPDLIFMDIHLSDGSAFNIFSAIPVDTPVVFTTAYDEHAIEAFKVNSIDYLLKPIEMNGIRRALNKYRKLNGSFPGGFKGFSALIAPDKYSDKLLIPSNNELIPVSVNHVSCFYSSGGSTRLILKDGSTFQYARTLDGIFDSLDPSLFFRANKQFIISKECVRNITIWFDNRLLVVLDVEAPERIYISKNKASQFKKWLTTGER
ncbi:MAG: LytTR family DNA-binding domain-containing protein [Tannerella sp.]|jgi:DNA-binding LytR/AlgR family response regulator|nr:LytTR family DNA-binding domain-containing protein [Tannerella sp.]